MSSPFGVYSEVGRLRKVMVHRPDLALRRLTPANHDALLFDDVLWVEHAQKEHDAFVEVMRDWGVEVYYVEKLLAETLEADPEAKRAIIARTVTEMTAGVSLVDEVRACLLEMPPHELDDRLIGGLTLDEMGMDLGRLARQSVLAAPSRYVDDPFVLPPLPNTLFTRTHPADLQRRFAQPHAFAPAVWKRSTSRPSTRRTPCFATPSSSSARRTGTTAASMWRTSGWLRSKEETSCPSATRLC